MLKKVFFCIILLACVFLMCSCKSNSVTIQVGGTNTSDYNEITDEDVAETVDQMRRQGEEESNTILDQYSDPKNEGGSKNLSFFSSLKIFYLELRKNIPKVGIISFILGFILTIFSRGNKRIQHFGLFGLMVGVPVCLLTVVYGYGWFKALFLG